MNKPLSRTPRRSLSIGLALTLLTVFIWAGTAESNEDEVIAILNGEPITLSQAKESVAFQVYRLRGNIYLLLKRETEKIVDQKLLQAEAARRAVTVEELLRREVDEKTPPLGEKAVDRYLAEHPEYAGKGARNRNRVRIYLSQLARSQRRSDFLASLRKKAGYTFLLEPPQRPRTKIVIDDEPWRGNPNAPVTVVHFASFTNKLSAGSVKMIHRLMQAYPNRIKWVHRNFFLIKDEKALSAARMAEAAHDQGRFWNFHDRLFALEGRFEPDDIIRVAEDLGLSRQYYEDGEREGRFLLKVKDDIRTASRIGLTTVPVIFVNGLYFSPTFPFEQLQALVSSELKRLAESPNPLKNASSSNRGGSY